MTRQDRLLYAGRVADARKALDLSQDELAARADTSRGTIGNIESGKTVPQAEVLWRIMGALDLRPDMSRAWSDEVEKWLSIMAPLLEQMTPEVRERAMQQVIGILAAAIRGA